MKLSQSEQRNLERAIRAKTAKETLDRLPGILEQLPSHAPNGYLYTPSKLPHLDPKYCPNLKGKVWVVGGDTFETAIQFDQLFACSDSYDTKPTCVLNMANAYTIGGGFRNGALAQEEELCYRSSLYLTLKRDFYPMKDYDAIYSPDVVVVRKTIGEGHQWLDVSNPKSLPVVSAVSIAAVGDPKLCTGGGKVEYRNSADREMMKEKMRVILRVAAFNRHHKLVLGAFGCGAFNNPKEEVAACFAEVFTEKEFQGWWETIAFAIMTPPGRSWQRPSLEIFTEMLDGLPI